MDINERQRDLEAMAQRMQTYIQIIRKELLTITGTPQ